LLEFIAKYWLDALFGLILTGLSFLVRRLFQDAKTARRTADAVQAGIRCMLRDRIIHSCEKYVALGCCPLPVRESLEEMHAAYRTLGGNGAIDHIVAEMNELPTVKKEDNIR
jgi:hypothetical protein